VPDPQDKRMWYVDPTGQSELSHSLINFALVSAHDKFCKALESEGVMKHGNCTKTVCKS
jgi:hypothetical protein